MMGESLVARWLSACPELGQVRRREYRCLSDWGRYWSMNECVTAQWLLCVSFGSKTDRRVVAISPDGCQPNRFPPSATGTLAICSA